MRLKTLKDIKNLAGKRVLLRVDFNVPLKNGKVVDDSRIRAALPTIEYLLVKNAKLILVSHLGRPKGVDKKYSLAPVAKCLSGLLDQKVRLLNYTPHLNPLPQVERKTSKIPPPRWGRLGGGDEITMLENIRFYSGEEKNDPKFAKELASLADIYVNDAFSVSHRAHASTVGVTKYLPSYAGLLLEKEVAALSALLQNSKKSFIALMGGAKISDKIAVIENLSKKADKILLGGALVNNFFKAMGYEVGASLVESEGVKLAKGLLKNRKIVLPVDVVVGTKDGRVARVMNLISNFQFPISKKIPNSKFQIPKLICRKPEAILDIGPKTILEYAQWIKKARTLVWNGPMGLFEVKKFSHGTIALGRLFAARSKGKAFGVAGGGETIEALNQTEMAQYVDWISMGGGAMLEFLQGKNLPGIEVLKKRFLF